MSTEELQQDSSLADDLTASVVYEDEPEGVEAEEVEAAETEETVEALEPAPKWDKRYKEVFTNLGQFENGREYQQAMLDLYGEQQGYATKVEQERAELRKQWEQTQPFVQRMNEALSPYQQFLAESGATPDQAVRQSMGLLMQLRANPQRTLIDLAKRMGVDLNAALSEQPWESPESKQLSELRSQFDRLRAEQAQREQRQAYEQMQRIQAENASQIEAFATATDDSGNPAHPHLETVQDIMAELIYGRENMRRSNPSLPAMGLDEAYDRACKLHPDVAQDSEKQAEAARLAKANATAKQAKTAATRVKTGTAGKEPVKKTLREEIEESLKSAA